MPRISPIVSAIVDLIPNGLYLRATSAEANVELDQIDLNGKILVLYNNLPDVVSTINAQGFVVEVWPVELEVVKLADYDDNDKDGDIIRADCLRIASFIIDSFPINSIQMIETYQTDFVDEVKIYDKTLTGLRLSFDYPINRELYCTDLNPAIQ